MLLHENTKLFLLPAFLLISSSLSGGTKLEDVTDLKKWLVEHPDYFTNCIASKLLTMPQGVRKSINSEIFKAR